MFIGDLMIVALAGAGCTGPFAEADAAYERGDYGTAIRLIRPLADQGDADAEFALGVMYVRGLGVRQDDFEAVQWFRKAAEQGKLEAETNLGIMYAGGHGVMKDYAAAVKWYLLAAERGDPDAQHNLGLLYEDGHGVTQDYVLAHMWYSLAVARYADLGKQPREELEKEYPEDSMKRRDAIAAKMTSAEIAESQKLVREWKPK